MRTFWFALASWFLVWASPSRGAITDEGPAGAVAMDLSGRDESWTFLAAAEWASRFLTEGRENWADSGLIAGAIGLGRGPLAAELWQGIADSAADREFESTVVWSHETGGVSLALRGTWISDTRGWSDWEFGLAAGADATWGISWEAELYHSVDSNGAYLEVSLNRELVDLDGWRIGLGMDTGVNLGYIRDGHRGFDHIGLRLESEWEIGGHGALLVGLGRYQSLGRDVREHAGDANLFDGWLLQAGMKWDY